MIVLCRATKNIKEINLPIGFKFFKSKNIQKSNELPRHGTWCVSMRESKVHSFNNPVEQKRVEGF